MVDDWVDDLAFVCPLGYLAVDVLPETPGRYEAAVEEPQGGLGGVQEQLGEGLRLGTRAEAKTKWNTSASYSNRVHAKNKLRRRI